MEELDVSRLSYLQCIIFETLCLSISASLVVPCESSADCTIGEYLVPHGTIVLANAWEDPTSKPKRLEGGDGEKCQKIILPFELGRRACPGTSLAQRVMGLTLGFIDSVL